VKVKRFSVEFMCGREWMVVGSDTGDDVGRG
jgi:hypothetical protein